MYAHFSSRRSGPSSPLKEDDQTGGGISSMFGTENVFTQVYKSWITFNEGTLKKIFGGATEQDEEEE